MRIAACSTVLCSSRRPLPPFGVVYVFGQDLEARVAAQKKRVQQKTARSLSAFGGDMMKEVHRARDTSWQIQFQSITSRTLFDISTSVFCSVVALSWIRLTSRSVSADVCRRCHTADGNLVSLRKWHAHSTWLSFVNGVRASRHSPIGLLSAPRGKPIPQLQ